MIGLFNTATVVEPGLYRMAEADYHGDPCPTPSLSRSVGQLLIEQSARHAWTAHPRLNPGFKPDETNERKADIGSAAHAMLLCQKTRIVEIEAPTYQSKAAKEARAEAYAAGAIPLLTADLDAATAMVTHAVIELAGSEEQVIRALADPKLSGVPFYNEVTACWRDRAGDRWCRARLDRLVLAPGRITIIDYKTTQASTAPAAVARAIFNNAYHMQQGFYTRGIRHLFPAIDAHDVELDFLFVVQEQDAPYEITVARVDAAGRVIGEKMASIAVRLWDQCLTTGEWPGYPKQTVDAAIPPFVETAFLASEVSDPRFDALPIDPVWPYEARPYEPKRDKSTNIFMAG